MQLFASHYTRNYSHVHTQLITPVKCGTTGVEVYGCFCKDPEANVEKVVSSPRQHQYNVSFDWNVELAEDKPQLSKKEASAKVVCSICGDTYTKAATVSEKTNSKATCANNGEIVLTAKVVVEGKTYTDEYTVNVPAAHEVVYEFATGVLDETTGNFKEFHSDSNYTATDNTQFHRAKCKNCGTYLSDWEKHTFSDFVQVKDEKTKEYKATFVASCACETKLGLKEYTLDEALKATSADKDYPVSRVVIKESMDFNVANGVINVPENVTLVVEDPFEMTDGTFLKINVAKGGHVEGNVGENVAIIDENSSEVDVTISANNLKNVIDLADGTDVKDVNITLDNDEKAVSLNALGSTKKDTKITIDLNNVKLTQNNTGRFLDVVDGSQVTIKNGDLKLKGEYSTKNEPAIKTAGKLTLENVDIESDGSAIYMASGDTLTITGGSIKSANGQCICSNKTQTPSNGEITLNGVYMEANKSVALFLPSLTTTKVNNCKITALAGIEVKCGRLDVSNSEIRFTGALPTTVATTNNGPVTTGGAILIGLDSSYIGLNEKVTVNVSNTTMKKMREDGSVDANNDPKIGLYKEAHYSIEDNLSYSGFDMTKDVKEIPQK